LGRELLLTPNNPKHKTGFHFFQSNYHSQRCIAIAWA
jgi:hypothetical protein